MTMTMTKNKIQNRFFSCIFCVEMKTFWISLDWGSQSHFLFHTSFILTNKWKNWANVFHLKWGIWTRLSFLICLLIDILCDDCSGTLTFQMRSYFVSIFTDQDVPPATKDCVSNGFVVHYVSLSKICIG